MTSTLYNFGAGPGCLPNEVLQQIRDDIPNWHDGMSVMEISHRLPVFIELTQKIEENLRRFLSIPNEFAVLFMQGGARTQFSATLLNLLNGAPTADYFITGHWSHLAYKDAERYCQPYVVATSMEMDFNRIPDDETWTFSPSSPYVHYTDNETIHGVEFPVAPVVQQKWLVTDVTSNIGTRQIDFAPHACLYASAQKNLGISGITVVIVRRDWLDRAHPLVPPTMHYSSFERSGSMMNTPPVFAWYVVGLIVDWALRQGGLPVLEKRQVEKSQLIYDVIDNTDFYTNQVYRPHRSRVNVPFRLFDEDLETRFIEEASKQGLKQLKGHASVGGCRASLYAPMPVEGAKMLADFMKHFEKTHG